jgi:DNA repair exonuclease SbcCD ATPase subunit
MITFKKIRFCNFLSTGNNFTEIDFNESKTTLIIGSNGSGKSTLLDALCFGLFNKAFRKITKSQLINSTNDKGTLVEVEFETNNNNWKVRRGIKPAIFEIYKDGEILDQLASVNDQQDWLEKNILKLNYKSFTQIVILGSASFIPFMQLTASNRREIVEDLLDIKIFSSMNVILKEKLKVTIDKVKDLNAKHSILEEKYSMQNNFLLEIEKSGRETMDGKQDYIDKLHKETDVLTNKNSDLLEYIEGQLQPELENLSSSKKTLKKLSIIKAKLEQRIQTIDTEYNFFKENTVCPTCTQSIENQFRLDKIVDIEKKSKELNDGYKELEDTINVEQEKEKKFLTYSTEITKLNNEISNNHVTISGINRQIKNLRNEIQDITDRLAKKNIERDLLEDISKKIKRVEIDRAKYNQLYSYYEFTQGLLKDGGVKKKIIKKYLPLMNQQINKYLQMMDLFINFNLDEEFNESIKTPIHEDFSYPSFSEGEKMRINLALLFTWREIAKMKNSVSTNLLILDEVFDSSLDGNGIEYFTKIIRYVLTDANILVISHKTDEMIDLFDKTIKFDKVKGFSKIVSC